MKNLILILFLFTINIQLAIGQFNSADDAFQALEWLVENPQVKSDSIFVAKSSDLIKWQVVNYPKTEMRVAGIIEFMDNCSDYKFYKEVLVIFMFSEFKNQITKKNLNETKSAVKAMKSVISYYNNILLKEPSLNNKILDQYRKMSKKELKTKMKELTN